MFILYFSFSVLSLFSVLCSLFVSLLFSLLSSLYISGYHSVNLTSFFHLFLFYLGSVSLISPIPFTPCKVLVLSSNKTGANPQTRPIHTSIYSLVACLCVCIVLHLHVLCRRRSHAHLNISRLFLLQQHVAFPGLDLRHGFRLRLLF